MNSPAGQPNENLSQDEIKALENLKDANARVRNELGKIIVGQEEVLDIRHHQSGRSPGHSAAARREALGRHAVLPVDDSGHHPSDVAQAAAGLSPGAEVRRSSHSSSIDRRDL